MKAHFDEFYDYTQVAIALSLAEVYTKAMKKNKNTSSDSTIALNKKARHDYFIEDTIEAGLALEGWEVKSLREKSIQITESYIFIKQG